MKRILIWLLILAMSLSFPITAFADPAVQTVYGQIPEDVDLIPGRTFTYEISIRDNLGFITGATTINWPAADFELKAIAYGLDLENNGSMVPGTNVNGTYTAVFGSDTAQQNTTENGVLLTLTFEILESATPGEKAITLTFGRDEDDFIAYDPIDTPSVPTAFEAGSVTLVEVHQTVYGQVIDAQNLIPEETFTYEVGIRDNFGIVTGACKLTWDVSEFELIDVTFGTDMPDNNTQPIEEAADGNYIVSFGSDTMTADYTGNGTLFTLTFKIASTATAGKKDIGITFGHDEDDFLNFDQKRMPTTFEPGSVTLQQISQTVYGQVIEKGLSPGKTFTYDVSIHDNVGIVVGAVKLSWPAEDLELTDIAFVGMDNNGIPSVETATNGEFIVSFGSDTVESNYTDDGVLFTLTYKIAGTATLGKKDITLTYGVDEDDFMNLKGITIPTLFESGSVTLVEVMGYDVTGTVISRNNIDDTVYLLYPSAMSDIDIRKDLLKDIPVAYLDSYSVTKETISPNSDGKRYNQTFHFGELLDGSYKIGIKKPSYAPLVLAFDVDGDDVDLGLLTIYIYGDINGDGSVKKNDLNVLAKHLAGWSGYETLPVYDAVADLNGDGNVKKNDQSILAKHLAGWDGYASLEDRLK